MGSATTQAPKQVLGLFASLLLGCSGAAGTGLYGDPDGGFLGGGDGGPGSGRDGASDATTTSDATTSDAGTRPPDASKPPPPPIDSGPADLGIHCGTKTCTAGAEECCRTGAVGSETFKCVSAGKCVDGTSPMPIPCDDRTDCAAAGHAGQICCATYETDGTSGLDHVIDVACDTLANCDPLATTTLVVCSLTDPAQCPTGTACKASVSTFVGYDLCL